VVSSQTICHADLIYEVKVDSRTYVCKCHRQEWNCCERQGSPSRAPPSSRVSSAVNVVRGRKESIFMGRVVQIAKVFNELWMRGVSYCSLQRTEGRFGVVTTSTVRVRRNCTFSLESVTLCGQRVSEGGRM
jgi:hypothetical protein